MGEQESKKAKKHICAGLLAHVDAGKTTLSESILYLSGSIRRLGRVDHKDAFLDTNELERARGITIFSKQAELELQTGAEKKSITLLDTPGHVDFSAEMERTLQVLDYAILVINGADGIQSHTLTLWKLLKYYQIPVFLFINKMDQEGTDRDALLMELQNRLDERCIDFSDSVKNADIREAFWDQLAMCDEPLMEEFLETGQISPSSIGMSVASRQVFPCYFGSALKVDGVKELLEGICLYSILPEYQEEFAAKIYKITRDPAGTRLTHLKITGGCLRVKTLLTNKKEDGSVPDEQVWQEKVDQIRIYSGSQYQAVEMAEAGTICALTGLSHTRSGEGLGAESTSEMPILEPVLNYQIVPPDGCDAHALIPKLRQLEEEEPHLHIVWEESTGEIHAQLMGEVEIEILKKLILERFGVEVAFSSGSIVYKETISAPVEGSGHFEPLRHYAEVHLLLEPGEPGSGMEFSCRCSEDMLARNWQRLVLTHLEERRHRGVLTGAEITDMKITLIAGRAHQKHTEGGDFRQATYRAIRQGLKKSAARGNCVLLEPVYEYQLEVPTENVGRAMADIQRMNGTFDIPQTEGGLSILRGSAPVATMRGYQAEVISYTKGLGRLFCTWKGYEPCHNAEEVMSGIGYDSEADTDHPTGSVFCSHGAGFVVGWQDADEYMHVDSGLRLEEHAEDDKETSPYPGDSAKSHPRQYVSSHPDASARAGAVNRSSYADEAELEAIFTRTYGTGKREKNHQKRTISPANQTASAYRGKSSPARGKEQYLLVDGYNIIFAWDELKELAEINLDSARTRLMDMLCNYQGYKKMKLILVFDAYKVSGGLGSVQQYHNIHVIYTKEAETADQYIEKAVNEIGQKYDVTVATSDNLEQMIIFGSGARRLSAQGLWEEIQAVQAEIREEFLDPVKPGQKHLPFQDIQIPFETDDTSDYK